MAEARQAVAFQFSVTEEGGLKFDYSTEGIKLLLLSGWKSTYRKYIQFRNSLLVGVFPASPISLLLIASILVAGAHFGHFDVVGLCDRYISLIPWANSVGSTARWTTLFFFSAILLWFMFAYFMQQLLKCLLMYHGYMFDEHGRVSTTTIIWQLAVRLVSSQVIGKTRLYSYQRSLPSLPVPPLQDTCRCYLASVKALLSEEDYQEMEKLVREFQETKGKKLQSYLWLKSCWSKNYVTDWWNQYVYLAGRSSLMINSNYYCTDARRPGTTLPAARMGMMTKCIMKMNWLIKTENLQPLMGQKLVPLCSTQYKLLFGTTRIPGKTMDTLQHTDSSHIAVYRKGRWYSVSTMYRNKPLTGRELEKQFQYILDDEADDVLPGERYMMALTSQTRDKWASDRETYFSTGKNKKSLSIIETALFVLIFEDDDHNLTIPEDVDDAKMSIYCKDLLCGRGWTRYFDKSFCMICYQSCYLGVNTEHSWADAPIIGYLLEFCSDMAYRTGYDESGHALGSVNDALPKPQRLTWELSEECVKVINEAVKFAQEKINDVDVYMMEHVAFGKGVIKKLKISPDAFIQMALQLAYVKDNGKQCLTYEASMTRLFRDGRTETVRSATVESAAFVRAMRDHNCPTKEKRRLLQEATMKHQYMYRMAMIGKGVDRHLFCLYVMSRYCNEESPFLKKVLSEPWRLSTSQTPTQQLGKIDYNNQPWRITSGGGFGPVAEDGYGVSYIIPGDYTIYFHVSSFKSSPKTNSMRFAMHIAESLKEMKDLFED